MNLQNLKTFYKDQTKLVGWTAFAVLVLLGLFLLAKTIDAVDRMGKSPYDGPNLITVSGTGKAETPPTIAKIVFTVEETAPTVQAAQDAAGKRTTDALNALQKLGVENKDVQAAAYQVNPQYDQPQACPPGQACPATTPKIVGYQVSQTVTVKIRATDMAGQALEALGSAGVQNISGPNFEVDDDSQVKAEARAKAIEDARTKAKELARELHVYLGDVVSYNEDNGPMPYAGYGKGGAPAMDMVAPVAVPLPQGQNETDVTVSVTYEIH